MLRILIGLCACIISSSLFAFNFARDGHLDLIGQIGPSELSVGKSTLGVTSSETDTLGHTNDHPWVGSVGLGYFIPLPWTLGCGNAHWLTAIEPALNLYYFNSIAEGDVMRFNDPEFNDMDYTLHLRSTRLMLDATLTLLTLKRFSVFVLGGLGQGWNQVNYRDDPKLGLDLAPVELHEHNYGKFVSEGGAGIAWDFNKYTKLSLEYLYTSFGTLKTSDSGNTDGILIPIIVPAEFRVHSQSILLGLHWTV